MPKTIAIVGGESLIAREIRELAEALKPRPEIRLLSGEAGDAKLARGDEGDAVVLEPMNAANLAGAAVVVLAGSVESSHRALTLTEAPVIDVTGALDDVPGARLGEAARVRVVAHAAARMLASFFEPLSAALAIRRAVAVVFEPASEQGHKGLHELQTQIVNLLSFKPLPKNVYDAQLGFNLLAALGEEAPVALETIEARVERHLASLLAGTRSPMPSLRLVQAPVFHAYSASVWVEFEDRPEAAALATILEQAGVDLRREEPPSNTAVAGLDGIAVGDVREDRNNSRAFWFWLAADNTRLAAAAAIAALREWL